MNKIEYLKKLDELNLDKNKYCIISGGVMLLYGLKQTTNDIDIQILPEYFEELKTRFNFKKSDKFSYLYEMADGVEAAVLHFEPKDVEIIDGYPVELLEKELEWKIANKREKDKESISIIKEYLKLNIKE